MTAAAQHLLLNTQIQSGLTVLAFAPVLKHVTDTPSNENTQRHVWSWRAELLADLTWASFSILSSWISLCLFAWREDKMFWSREKRSGEKGGSKEKDRGVYLQQNNQKSLEVTWSVTTNIFLQVTIVLWQKKTHILRVNWFKLNI